VRQGDKVRGRGGEGVTRIKTHRELDVYRMGFEAAMKVFEVTKGFPKEEVYHFMPVV